jgi:hypothetical protein
MKAEVWLTYRVRYELFLFLQRLMLDLVSLLVTPFLESSFCTAHCNPPQALIYVCWCDYIIILVLNHPPFPSLTLLYISVNIFFLFCSVTLCYTYHRTLSSGKHYFSLKFNKRRFTRWRSTKLNTECIKTQYWPHCKYLHIIIILKLIKKQESNFII